MYILVISKRCFHWSGLSLTACYAAQDLVKPNPHSASNVSPVIPTSTTQRVPRRGCVQELLELFTEEDVSLKDVWSISGCTWVSHLAGPTYTGRVPYVVHDQSHGRRSTSRHSSQVWSERLFLGRCPSSLRRSTKGRSSTWSSLRRVRMCSLVSG